MSEKEFIHVEVDPNNKLSAKMYCTPEMLVIMIASMLINIDTNPTVPAGSNQKLGGDGRLN